VNISITPFKSLSLVLLCFVASLPIYSQPVLKEQNRIKDFGKSLKKYEKKDGKETDKTDTKNDETIRVETNLVVNDVLVVNQKGNLIAGLKKEDFIVTENGEPQDVELFSFGEDAKVPRSIVLIIDYSGSLTPYLNNSIEAAKLLVDKLSPQDRMAIVTDDIKLLADFTRDKILLKESLESLKDKAKLPDAQGGWGKGHSLQYSALIAALQELFDDEDIRPIVIFQTDGDEYRFFKSMFPSSETERKNLSILCKSNIWFCERKYSLNDFFFTVEKSRATIYSVIPGVRFVGVSDEVKLRQGEIIALETLKKSRNFDEKIASKISKDMASNIAKMNFEQQTAIFATSKLSGGYTDFLENPEDAQTVYSTIFQTIENRYVIGYYPKNETKDGKRRTVKIEVKNHPEYIVMGRKSYIAPLEEK
jgi:VWFA-related protein